MDNNINWHNIANSTVSGSHIDWSYLFNHSANNTFFGNNFVEYVLDEENRPRILRTSTVNESAKKLTASEHLALMEKSRLEVEKTKKESNSLTLNLIKQVFDTTEQKLSETKVHDVGLSNSLLFEGYTSRFTREKSSRDFYKETNWKKDLRNMSLSPLYGIKIKDFWDAELISKYVVDDLDEFSKVDFLDPQVAPPLIKIEPRPELSTQPIIKPEPKSKADSGWTQIPLL